MSQPPQTPPPPPPGDQPSPSPSWGAPGGALPPQRRTNGLAVAALVCGIIALLVSWIPFVNFISFVLGLVAVGTGIGGIRRAAAPDIGQKGLAVAGLVTGIIAVLLSLVIFVTVVGLLNDPEISEPIDRLLEGEDPQDVLDDLEQEDADVADDEEPAEEPAEEPEDAPQEVPTDAEFARIGEPARDGQFEFVVTAFECGVATVGEDFFVEEASGQFCIITMTVENIGESAQALSATDQFLYDADERQFSASIEAGLALGSPLFEQINPGNTVEGQVPFDVPEGATIEFAELHDSPFSGGVLVDLR